MQEFKFRFVDLNTGEFVYAELGEVSAEIRPEYLSVINDDGIFTVDATTVAQLVGYDSDGKEIYEGDTVIDRKGFTYKAFLQPAVEWQTEKIISPYGRDMPIDFCKKFTSIKIKETDNHEAD